MYMGNKTVPFSCRLSRKQYDKILELAKKTNISSSALLCQIIDTYFRKEKNEDNKTT